MMGAKTMRNCSGQPKEPIPNSFSRLVQPTLDRTAAWRHTLRKRARPEIRSACRAPPRTGTRNL